MLKEFSELIAQMSTVGNPWMPSQRQRFLNSQRGPYVKEPELNKWYFLAEGSGSFYEGNNSVGYFQVGSVLRYITPSRIEISGMTFKVLTDGPHPTWTMPMRHTQGDTIPERPPIIMELEEVIANAKQLLG